MSKVFSKLAIAAALIVGAASSAQAYSILRLTDVSAAVTLSCDTSAAVSATNCAAGLFSNFVAGGDNIQFSGVVGSFSTAATFGLGNNTGLLALLDTGNVFVHRTDTDIGGGLKALLVSFTVLDIASPPDSFKTLSGSGAQVGGSALTGSESVITRVAVNADNTTVFFPPVVGVGSPASVLQCTFSATTNNSCAATDTGLAGGATSVVWADPALPSPFFSMQSQQRFTLTATGAIPLQNSSINTVSHVEVGRLPEPMSTALVGIALFGLAVTARRRIAAK